MPAPSADFLVIEGVTVVDERPRAINCHWNSDGIDHWLARSQLCPGTTVQRVGDRGTVIITQWLAQRARILRPEARANG